MKSGIGKASRRLEFLISCLAGRQANFKFLIILFLLTIFLPRPALATSTIDFSSFKDYFKEIKLGDKVNGDVGSGGIPNPYEGKGFLVGYKFSVPTDTDISKLDVNVHSCSFLFAFICLGNSFSEVIYVYNNDFKPIGEGLKFKNNIDFAKLPDLKGKTLYFLVGSEDATGTGQYILSANLKNSSQ